MSVARRPVGAVGAARPRGHRAALTWSIAVYAACGLGACDPTSSDPDSSTPDGATIDPGRDADATPVPPLTTPDAGDGASPDGSTDGAAPGDPIDAGGSDGGGDGRDGGDAGASDGGGEDATPDAPPVIPPVTTGCVRLVGEALGGEGTFVELNDTVSAVLFDWLTDEATGTVAVGVSVIGVGGTISVTIYAGESASSAMVGEVEPFVFASAGDAPIEAVDVCPPVACVPTGDELCDGQDNDCDPETPDGADEPEAACDAEADADECTDDHRACRNGSLVCDDSPSDRSETCNGADDDCDGETDEGCPPSPPPPPMCTFRGDASRVVVFASTYPELATIHSGCTGIGAAGHPTNLCQSAVHRLCQTQSCGGASSSGFGPVESLAADVIATCHPATVVQETFTALRAFHPECRGPSLFCNAAIHRRCASLGFVSGHGPVEYFGDIATYACVADDVADVIATNYAVLSSQHPACDGVQHSNDIFCDSAAHRLCRTLGYDSGFGPVEAIAVAGGAAVVTCVGG